MPHQTPFTPAATRFERRGRHTKYKTRFLALPALKPSARSSRHLMLELSEIIELQAAKDDGATAVAPASPRSHKPGQETKPLFVLASRALQSDTLVRRVPRSGGVPPLLCRQPRRGGLRGRPAEITNFSRHRRARHNPSLNHRTHYGRPPGPVWRYAVHFRQPGPGVLPQRSG